MGKAVFAVILSACSIAGCEKSVTLGAPLPATAEGLSGTKWQLDDIVLEFGTPPDLVISGDAVPFGKPLNAKYVVNNGIIEITAMGKTRAGTWDGRAMVIDGIDAVLIDRGGK